MKRRLAALLTCALIAFAQRPHDPPPAEHVVRFVDFLALDESGRPVTDLAVQDLEVSQTGHPRKIAGLTWFDTRLHTARASDAGAFALVPDEIHRNFIAIVDDLGLSAAGITAAQESLRTFVGLMESGDRLAVLRTSGGAGVQQQLTLDRRILGGAIDGIEFLGGSATGNSSAGACRLTLTHALQGLQQFRGRKFIVLFSENMRADGPDDRSAASLQEEANSAMTAVYNLNPLAASTSGAELSRILQAEEGFYVLGFEEPPPDSARPRAWNDPPLLTVRRPGIVLHPRSRPFTLETAQDFPAPADRLLQIRRALQSPFAGETIHTRMTPYFTSFVSDSAVVDVRVLIDARDLSVIRDAKDFYHGSLRLTADARSDLGRVIAPIERAYEITMGSAEYEQVQRHGFVFPLSLRLPSAGVWRIRTLVADGISDRMGSSAQCLRIPTRGEFAISSLNLRAEGSEELDPARIFKSGANLQFVYDVFQPVVSENKQVKLEVRTRLYARGHAVFVGAPMEVTYPAGGPAAHRQVTGRLTLARDVAPGEYILEVTVVDKLAPADAPRKATRFIDFQLRD
jgi:hypothetical protein